MAKQKEELKVVRKWKNGSALFSNGYVRTPVARLCFVNFSEKRKQTNDDGEETEGKYGCTILFNKDEDLSAIKLCLDKFTATLGSKAKKLTRKTPLRKQDEKSDDYDGFVDGAFFLNSSTKFQPKVIGRAKEEMEPSDIYSGCYCRLTLHPYSYDAKGNRGVGLGLSAVQFIRDGEPLGGGGIDPSDVFDADESANLEDDDGLL